MQEIKNALIKVIVWRVISILLTLGVTYLYIGSIAKSLGLTLVLQVVLVISHLWFELIWPKLFKRHKKEKKNIIGD